MPTDFGPGLILDFLNQPINVRWGTKPDEQGLLAEYPPGPGAPDFESIQDVMRGTPTAYALDSGQSFEGVNMGASGLGYTVLARGLVCFGNPRDGDPCFIACPGYKYYSGEGSDALQRGVLNEEEELAWGPTGGGTGGKLIALSFAEDAFFAVYYDYAEDSTTIATSFDGIVWSRGSPFSSSGGAVAATFKMVEDDEGGPDRKVITYVSAGDIGQDNSEIMNSVSNLLWAVSNDGLEWSSGSNTGVLAEPGTNYFLLRNYACTVAAGSVDADRKIFVAAAATKTRINNPDEPESEIPFVMLSTGAAVSETGNTWDTISVEGLPAGLDQISFGLAATYCREKDSSGHFLMTDHEFITGEEGHATPNSTLYKSPDGNDWSKIKTNTNWMATLSAIARDLDKTTIVHI